MERIRTIIADDSAPVREGLHSLLDIEDDIEVVAEAANGEEAVQKARELEPDVILMDYSMPILNGAEATREIKRTHPETAVVFVSMDTEAASEAIDSGASDFLLKGSPIDLILDSVRSAHLDLVLRTVLETIGRGWPELLHKKVQESALSASQVKQVLKTRQPGEPKCGRMCQQCNIDEDAIHEELAGILGVPYMRLAPYEVEGIEGLIDPVDSRIALLLPEELAREHQMVAIAQEGHELIVAMADPTNAEAIAQAAAITSKDIRPFSARFCEVAEALDRVYIPVPAIVPAPAPEPVLVPVRRPSVWRRTVDAVNTVVPTLPRNLSLHTVVLIAFFCSVLLAMFTVLQVVQSPHYIPAGIALTCGFFFFFYGMKYYVSTAMVLAFSTASGGGAQLGGNGNGNGNGKHSGTRHEGYKTLHGQPINRNGVIDCNGDENGYGNGKTNGHGNGNGNGNGNGYHLPKEKQPFVSIHLATYNEELVIDRLLSACTAMDYDNYEVVIVDDSTDGTVEKLEKWKSHPRVKAVHRESRKGFKGSALQVALGRMDPRTKYIMIYDADFVPPPDSIYHFLDYFGELDSNGNGH
ncbi:MAG: response regulator, partial [Chloroflexota bacterium]